MSAAPESHPGLGMGGTNGTSETSGTVSTRPTAPVSLGEIAGSLERIACALEELVRTAKEKENLPPTPPIREKESPTEVIEREPTPARTREGGDLTCEGFLVPTLDEVKSVAASLGIPAETAEDFWNTNSATGWTYKGSRIIVWHPLLKAWHRAKKRAEAREKAQLERIDAKMDEREAKRQAHIDAKMDEREAKRERRTGGGRKKSDNYIASTPEQVKEFTDGL